MLAMILAVINKKAFGTMSEETIDNTPKRGRRDRSKLKAQIASYLDDFIWRNKYTEEQLAVESQVDRTTISRIRNQKVVPNENTLVALAHIVGVGLLFAAGYDSLTLPSEFVTTTQQATLNAQLAIVTTAFVEIPDLDDPELAFYLKQIGQTDQKTRQIIKNILKAELSSSSNNQTSSSEGQPLHTRPDFARPLQQEN